MDEMPTSTIEINKKNGLCQRCQTEIQTPRVLPPLSTFLKSQSSTKSVDRHPPKCSFSSVQRPSETDLVAEPKCGAQNTMQTSSSTYRSGYDNLAVGHFMPQQLKSVCSTQSVHKSFTRHPPNTKCYQAMHLDILPSPVDSINSPTTHQPSDPTSPCPELSPDPNYVTSSLDKESYDDQQVIADTTMFCGSQDPFCTCQDDVLSNLLSTDHLYTNCMDQIPSTYLDVLHPNDLSSIFLSPQSSAVTTPPSDFLPSPPPNKACEETHPIKQETTWTVLPPLGDFLENNSSVQIGPQFPVSCSDLSSCPSTFASPRHSYSSRGSRNKRSLSISPLSAEGLDLNTIIRMSPTSLVAYLGGSRSSSSSMSPAGDKTGCYGHLSARNSTSSPQSGYSVPRLSVSSYTPHNHPLGVRNDCVDLENNLAVYQTMGVLESNCLLAEDIAANNQLVMTQGAVQYLENPQSAKSEPFTESCLYPADASSTLPPPGPVPARPPPSYDQHMARKLKFQKKSSSDSSQSQPSSFSSFESSEGERVTDGTDTEQGKPYYVCRWADCTCTTFQEQDELVKHLEKSHVDQRKGEEFACFWQGCPRRYRPFNARYKLLIHMRVHSGEKPNKCTFEGCTKAFSRLENLKIHLRSHTGERPYVCQYTGCAKAFSNSSDRAKHQRTHQDTKPYACQIPGCTKRYTDPSSLRKHVKNHTAKNDPARKKPRSSVGELDPELLNECLTIQPIPIMTQCEGSPVDNVDSCLGRTQPPSTQHQIGLTSPNRIHPSFSSHDGNMLLDGRNESLNQLRCRRVPILPPVVHNDSARSRSLGLSCSYGTGGHPPDAMNAGTLRKPQISPRNFAVPNFSPNYKHETDYHENVVSLPSLDDVTSSLSSFDTLSHFGGVS